MDYFFKKGDFVKYATYSDQDKFTFGIFEGVDLAPQWKYAKKYSLVAYYDSKQYTQDKYNLVKYEYKPTLSVARDDCNQECAKTIDTLKEDSWWKLCTNEDKKRANEILKSYGYEWNDETMELIDLETGEILHQIKTPKLEYNGNPIKPIDESFKNILKKAALSQIKTSYYTNQYQYGYYD